MYYNYHFDYKLSNFTCYSEFSLSLLNEKGEVFNLEEAEYSVKFLNKFFLGNPSKNRYKVHELPISNFGFNNRTEF